MTQPSTPLGFFMSEHYWNFCWSFVGTSRVGVAMWQLVLKAIALVLIIEGVTPFLYPTKWRQLVQQLSMIDNNTLRLIGFASMVLGVGLLYLIKDFT
ncbi:MAG TPA: DUF2065 domain-containing protein [Cellvibrionaceae bacterium]